MQEQVQTHLLFVFGLKLHSWHNTGLWNYPLPNSKYQCKSLKFTDFGMHILSFKVSLKIVYWLNQVERSLCSFHCPKGGMEYEYARWELSSFGGMWVKEFLVDLFFVRPFTRLKGHVLFPSSKEIKWCWYSDLCILSLKVSSWNS